MLMNTSVIFIYNYPRKSAILFEFIDMRVNYYA